MTFHSRPTRLFKNINTSKHFVLIFTYLLVISMNSTDFVFRGDLTCPITRWSSEPHHTRATCLKQNRSCQDTPSSDQRLACWSHPSSSRIKSSRVERVFMETSIILVSGMSIYELRVLTQPLAVSLVLTNQYGERMKVRLEETPFVHLTRTSF